jgi:hypothetical protein
MERAAPPAVEGFDAEGDDMSKETPKDDPRERSDWKSSKQTDEPWKGVPEQDQLDPTRKAPDVEKWNETDTH